MNQATFLFKIEKLNYKKWYTPQSIMKVDKKIALSSW